MPFVLLKVKEKQRKSESERSRGKMRAKGEPKGVWRGGVVAKDVHLLPDVSPCAESNESQPHDEIGEIGQRVQAEQAEKSRDKVEEDGHHEERGRRLERFEDVLALVLRPVVHELLFDLLQATNKDRLAVSWNVPRVEATRTPLSRFRDRWQLGRLRSMPQS